PVASRRIFIFTGPRQASIYPHRDVSPERSLNLHRNFRRNKSRRPIHVVLEMHALLSDLAQLGQRKNLVTATIGENWSIPIHELMKSTEVPDDIDSRSHEQMIGISEDDLRSEFVKLMRTHGLHASLSSDRHEGRSLDRAMLSFETPNTRFCAFVRRSYFKHRPNLSK